MENQLRVQWKLVKMHFPFPLYSRKCSIFQRIYSCQAISIDFQSHSWAYKDHEKKTIRKER